jgi:hypothetical protein
MPLDCILSFYALFGENAQSLSEGKVAVTRVFFTDRPDETAALRFW